MNTLNIVLLILNLLLLLFLFIKYIINKIVFNYLVNKNLFDKKFCNDCELGFTNPDETNYKYCPFCGKELDYHINFKESDFFDEYIKTIGGDNDDR